MSTIYISFVIRLACFTKCTRNEKSTRLLRVDAPYSSIFVLVILYHNEDQHDVPAKSSGASNTSEIDLASPNIFVNRSSTNMRVLFHYYSL
jgi:hypothetical protein